MSTRDFFGRLNSGNRRATALTESKTTFTSVCRKLYRTLRVLSIAWLCFCAAGIAGFYVYARFINFDEYVKYELENFEKAQEDRERYGASSPLVGYFPDNVENFHAEANRLAKVRVLGFVQRDLPFLLWAVVGYIGVIWAGWLFKPEPSVRQTLNQFLA